MTTAPSTYFAFCGARLQLPRKSRLFRGDLQLALIPLESTYVAYAGVYFCGHCFHVARSRIEGKSRVATK
ncbi:hypothetical protein EV213_105174 [Aureibacillus halotolerans]|uniref:Uncharacterized protein n=1 Tax=Aureibacillus halotolerans TaxID=1508390 RepID=A0A4R6U308_9BACI|nr:hypothetical protein EV213_105174 [Aureibacillus halotolerans]